MSKTMDNDANIIEWAKQSLVEAKYIAEIGMLKAFNEGLIKGSEHLRAEIERLKAINKHYVSLASENDTLRARVEELEVQRVTEQARDLEQFNRVSNERDELKARVEELESVRIYGPAVRIKKERDELREKNANLSGHLLMANEEVQTLRTRLTTEQDAGHTSAARIVELEGELDMVNGFYCNAAADRDEVREKLTKSYEAYKGLLTVVSELNQKLAAANDKLAALQPKENKMIHYIVSKEFLDACTAPGDMWEDERGPWELSDEEYNAALVINQRDRLAALQPPAPTIVRQTWQAVTADEETHGHHRPRSHAIRDNALALIRRDHMSDGTVVVTLETL